MARLFLVATLALAIMACSGSDRAADMTRHRPTSFDTKKLDTSNFASDPVVQRRVLYMSFGEAAARLGSARFEGKSGFGLERGALGYDQDDVYTATQDSKGNFHVQLVTPLNQVEVYLVDEALYVRQDGGLMRQNERPDLSAESWTDVAWSSLAQSVELFRPRLAFGEGGAVQLHGRATTRYSMQLGTARPPESELPRLPIMRLPEPPPPAWRQKATPLELKGELWIDDQTGVPLKIALTGTLEVADREVKPTRLALRYTGEISQAGTAASITAPKKAVLEQRRDLRDPDPLSFFRQHLPPPSAKN